MAAVKKMGDELKLYMDEKFSALDNKFHDLLTSKSEEIDSLKVKVRQLEHLVAKIQQNADDADAYERRDTLIISGSALPVPADGEICKNVVTQVVEEKLHIKLNPGDISVSHRLGLKPQAQGPDKRPIIVKFCRRDVKRDVLSSSRRLRVANLYCNESLTPGRKQIFATLRRIKKKHSVVKGVTTQDGRVYAFTKPVNPTSPDARDQRHLINSHEALVSFCRDSVKIQLESFLAEN